MKKELPQALLRDTLEEGIRDALDRGITIPVMREYVLCNIFRYEDTKDNILFLAKDGYPIEWLVGSPITSFLRRLIHTRKIQRYETFYQNTGCKISF